MERVRWPVTAIATRSGTPARTILRAAVRRRSWNSLSGTPATSQAVAQALRKSCPSPKPHPLRSWMVHARAGQREVRARLTHVRAQRTCSKRWRLVGGRGVGILRLSGLPGETRFSAEDRRRERREERRARVGGGED